MSPILVPFPYQSLAYEGGADLVDKEMVQFYPTGMVWPETALGGWLPKLFVVRRHITKLKRCKVHEELLSKKWINVASLDNAYQAPTCSHCGKEIYYIKINPRSTRRERSVSIL